MFTPPPSPLPVPSKDLLEVVAPIHPLSSQSKKGGMQTSKEAISTTMQSKQKVASRTRWTILLVPAVLILVAISSRKISLGHGLEDIAEETFGHLGHERIYGHHKRSPLPQTIHISDPASPSAKSLEMTSQSLSPSQTSSQSSSTTPSASQTQQAIPSVPDSANPPILPTPFPQPYDSVGATSNLSTTGCINFFANMTQESSFRTCRALSLLEMNSQEFLQQAQTNLSELNTLIFGTCNTTPSFLTCTLNMDWFASALPSACSQEIAEDNSMVQQTLLALKAYPIVRTTGCLIDQSTNQYCYLEAAHSQNPYESYLYLLPLGLSLPNDTTPSCSACSRTVLNVYAEALQTPNSSSDGLKDTYNLAASQAEESCGSGFAQTGLASGAPKSQIMGFKVEDGWGLVVLSLWMGILLVL